MFIFSVDTERLGLANVRARFHYEAVGVLHILTLIGGLHVLFHKLCRRVFHTRKGLWFTKAGGGCFLFPTIVILLIKVNL